MKNENTRRSLGGFPPPTVINRFPGIRASRTIRKTTRVTLSEKRPRREVHRAPGMCVRASKNDRVARFQANLSAEIHAWRENRAIFSGRQNTGRRKNPNDFVLGRRGGGKGSIKKTRAFAPRINRTSRWERVSLLLLVFTAAVSRVRGVKTSRIGRIFFLSVSNDSEPCYQRK